MRLSRNTLSVLVGIGMGVVCLGLAGALLLAMAAGIDYASASAKLISFPRDLWVALPDLQGYNITEGRINTAYFNGEAYDLPGGGPALAAKTVTVNFGIRIHRTVVVD